ncbi:hypothetical protein BDQ12DRAFT_686182 [Crucibulum laeve]|uniref:Uncharacterized protein n=1 Tax=Crucibulum laeve TaxID=68775 RepID=A0A5C3LXW7_9AGAR|nr:hypothetical protein BDQ12DRAFT_686182 [Crucibulum laeve]
MAEKTARTYTHASNRAKLRDGGERKVIFKGVMDNPFRIQWPSVPVNLQNSTLVRIIPLLQGVAHYHHVRSKLVKKRKHDALNAEGKKSAPKHKRRKIGAEDTAQQTEEMDVEPPIIINSTPTASHPVESTQDADVLHEAPEVLKHITFGINEVTKKLEAQIRDARRTLLLKAESEATPTPSLKVLLVCRADVDPPLLIDHLPHLVAAYNSAQTQDTIKLVPLPKGAELTLADTIGVRRVAVLGFHTNFPALQDLLSTLDPVPTLTASWLSAAQAGRPLIQTHVKQVRTSAPKDMKAAKEQRAAGKAAAKQRRKSTGRIIFS